MSIGDRGVFKSLCRFIERCGSKQEAAKRLGVSAGSLTKWTAEKNEYRGDKTRLRTKSLEKMAQSGDPELRRAAQSELEVRKVSVGELARPQLVRWGPNDGLPAGIKLTDPGANRDSFIAWDELLEELRTKLRHQLFANASTFDFITADHHSKRDWLVFVIDQQSKEVCYVWFGGDPARGWRSDGLIRFGRSEREVWQVYQRYSDGSYHRVKSRYRTLDVALRSSPRNWLSVRERSRRKEPAGT